MDDNTDVVITENVEALFAEAKAKKKGIPLQATQEEKVIPIKD